MAAEKSGLVGDGEERVEGDGDVQVGKVAAARRRWWWLPSGQDAFLIWLT